MKDVKISDYLWFQEGPGVRNTQYTTSGVKLINVANLVDGNVDLSTSDRYISEEEAYGKYNHFLADDGDFVIASSGIKIDYFDKKMGFIKKEHLPLCMNTSCIRFKVLDTNNLEIKYFMYYLKSNSFKKQLFNQITGSAQLNFGPSHLKKMTFPLIELKEQKRIIERLDKTQNIINETKSLLSKYDTLIKSRFIEMFGDPVQNPMGWEVRKLKETTDIITGNTPSRKDKENYGAFIEWIKTDNITDKTYVTTAAEYLSEKGEMLGRTVEAGSILMACIAGSLRSIGRVALTDRKVAFNQQINAIVPKKYNSLFLYVLFQNTQSYVQSTVNMALKGILSKGKLEELEYIIPPIELQNDFASFVQQIDKSKFEIANSLKRLYNKGMLS